MYFEQPNNLPPLMGTYERIYILSCRESNLSPDRLHPSLTLREPDMELDQPEESVQVKDVFPFDDLPLTVQFQILGHLLVFPGKLIHVLTRLDPYHLPESLDSGLWGNDYDNLRLLHRFHIGSEPVNVTYATRPEDLLAPLLVCRKWLMFGAEQFYSENTFCFSGLGELARFAKGCKGRWPRVRSIELLWIGSQWLTYKWNDRKKRTSRRTLALLWLSEGLRLTNLKVWIPESSRFYMRRKHEPRGVIRYMTEKTRKQPNYRQFRSLRTLQGLDYVHCLRGLMDVTWWDHDLWVKHKTKKRIRDWTFEQDVKTATYMAKEPEEVERARLRKLVPLLKTWQPPLELWRVVLNSIPDIIVSAKEGSRTSNVVTSNDNDDDDGDEGVNGNQDDESDDGSSTSGTSGSSGSSGSGSNSSDSDSDSDSGDEDGTQRTRRIVTPATFDDAVRSARPSPLDEGLPGSDLNHMDLNFDNSRIVLDDDSDIEITEVRSSTTPSADVTGEGDTQTITVQSSQTISSSQPLVPASMTEQDHDMQIDENPEGSLFLPGRAATVASGSSNAGGARLSNSPPDGLNQIREHTGLSRLGLDGRSPESSHPSSGGSEGGIFCSPTPYRDAAPRSTTSTSPTWRDRSSDSGSSPDNAIDLTQDTEMASSPPREDLKRSQSEDGGDEDGGSPSKRSRSSRSPRTQLVQDLEAEEVE